MTEEEQINLLDKIWMRKFPPIVCECSSIVNGIRVVKLWIGYIDQNNVGRIFSQYMFYSEKEYAKHIPQIIADIAKVDVIKASW